MSEMIDHQTPADRIINVLRLTPEIIPTEVSHIQSLLDPPPGETHAEWWPWACSQLLYYYADCTEQDLRKVVATFSQANH